MKDISLHTTFLTFNNIKNNIKNTSLKHSLRIQDKENTNINFDNSKTKNNYIFFNNVVKKQNTFTTQQLTNIYNNLTKKDIKIKMETKDIKVKSKSISYIKKYINDENFNKIFDNYIFNYNKQTKQDLENYIEDFKKNNVKIKKSLFNNLEKLEKIMSKYGSTKDTQHNNKINFVEFILKIPGGNEIDSRKDITSLDLLDNSIKFFEKYFPNFEIKIGFAHNDELHKNNKNNMLEGQHCHIFLDTKNKLTNEFDFYKQQKKIVKDYVKNNNKVLEKYISKEEYNKFLELNKEEKNKKIDYLFGKDNVKQNYKQTQNIGKILQEIIYDFTNKNLLNKKNFNAVIYKNTRTKQQKKEIELDSKKKISKRNFNGYNLIQERKKELEKSVKNIEEFLFLKEFKEFDFTQDKEIFKWYKEKKEEIKKEIEVELLELENKINLIKDDLFFKENMLKNKEIELKNLENNIYNKKKDIKINSNKLEEKLEKIVEKNIEKSKKFFKLDTNILKENMLNSLKNVSNYNFIVKEESKLINNLKYNINKLKNEKEELENNLNKLENMLKNKDNKINELENSINKFKQKLENYINKIDIQENDIDTLKREIEIRDNKIFKFEIEKKDKVSKLEFNKINKKLKLEKNKNSDLEKKLEKYTNKIDIQDLDNIFKYKLDILKKLILETRLEKITEQEKKYKELENLEKNEEIEQKTKKTYTNYLSL